MSLLLDEVLLRWYRSFNTQSAEREVARPWETVDGAAFQFVNVDIDPRITTIVGANESGKSHLISAISKIFTRRIDLKPSDICRHCAYDSLDKSAVPQIGVRLRSGTSDNAPINGLLQALGIARDTPPHFVVAILQPSNEPFATIYDDTHKQIGTVNQSQWYMATNSTMPEVELIEPDVKFGSHIHISQLLAAWDDSDVPLPRFFDTMPLNEVGRSILELDVPPVPAQNEKPDFPNALRDGVESAQKRLQAHMIKPLSGARLERDLFKDILEIPKPKLEEIQTLGKDSRGYIELLVSDINQRIKQRLDLSHFWSQDEDISLGVNYKDGFFYFEIHDKTGRAFTFEERSSGLQYFLAYYVQSLAIKKRNPQRGCIAIMDEPDRFLSAVAQRNLLEVFEMLTVPMEGRRLQLIYTTHSPFSINKNFPSRIRLVRKGDGSEGTQLVDNSSSRNYEPVRSALGIEAGDTLFFGMNNIIVEGYSDQKAIIAGSQLCAADPHKSLLNLNAVTFLAANGVGKLQKIVQRTGAGTTEEIAELVRRSSAGDERRPVTIALLDGDTNGKNKIQEIKDKNILPPKTYATYSDVGISLHDIGDESRTVEVLEDVIPLDMLSEATRQYLMRSWKKATNDVLSVSSKLSSMNEINLAERIVAVVREIEPLAESVSKVHIKGEIIDIVFDELISQNQFETARRTFTERAELIVKKLNELLQVAERMHRQANIRMHARNLIDPFTKLRGIEATRFDVMNLLRDLSLIVTGTSEDARKTREQIAQLEELLDEESTINTDLVNASSWKARFQEFWNCPWAEPKRGWRQIGKLNNKSAPRPTPTPSVSPTT